MKRLFGLVAVGLTVAICPWTLGTGQAQTPAAPGTSTAIAVDGDYVYVVENGMVYKLSSRDLKPVATTVLPPRNSTRRQSNRQPSQKKRRGSTSWRRSAVSRQPARRRTAQAATRKGTLMVRPLPRRSAVKEAPLPPM